jgi:hypothetical protein
LLTASWGIRLSAILSLFAQTTYERAFPQSKGAVEKALTAMQASLGHLPVLTDLPIL